MVPSLSEEPLPSRVTGPPSFTTNTPFGQTSDATGGSLVHRMLTILSVLPCRLPSETVRRKVRLVVAKVFGATNATFEPFVVTLVSDTVGEPPIWAHW